MREEILPDVDSRMKMLVDKSMKDLEERMRQLTNTEGNKRSSYIPQDLRIKLGEMNEKIRDIHITSPHDISNNDTVIDVIARTPSSKDIKKRNGFGN